jgi:hypothetical protein
LTLDENDVDLATPYRFPALYGDWDELELSRFCGLRVVDSCTACAAAVAFYKWRKFYDAGDAERWDGLNELIRSGRLEMQNGLLPRLADLVWESRKANRIVFEHELYATFIYLFLKTTKTNKLSEIIWLELPQRHVLLPAWEIKKNLRGQKIFSLHCRANRTISDHLLNRMHREFSTTANRPTKKSRRGRISLR